MRTGSSLRWVKSRQHKEQKRWVKKRVRTWVRRRPWHFPWQRQVVQWSWIAENLPHHTASALLSTGKPSWDVIRCVLAEPRTGSSGGETTAGASPGEDSLVHCKRGKKWASLSSGRVRRGCPPWLLACHGHQALLWMNATWTREIWITFGGLTIIERQQLLYSLIHNDRLL